MPDGTVECGVILEQLRAVREDISDLKKDIADLKTIRAQSDGERNALAKIGAGVIGLCAVIGAIISVVVNLPKWIGHP